MTSVLETIAAATRKRVSAQQQLNSESELRDLLCQARATHDFTRAFESPGLNVIAEIKRASPSQGAIALNLDPLSVADDYLENGAVALSILTEPDFFQGSLEILAGVRAHFPEARLLMKDFILEPYQLLQGRLAGADACLLIVAMLSEESLTLLYQEALNLDLTPLIEVHNQAELKLALALKPRLVGVNNRNLKTLATDLETSRLLSQQIPGDILKICESGLTSRADLQQAAEWGYNGFLVGTHLMASGQPGAALKALLADADAC